LNNHNTPHYLLHIAFSGARCVQANEDRPILYNGGHHVSL